jgi:hypothetical protein
MKVSFFLIFFGMSTISFSQSKKEIIEILSQRVDSLNLALKFEKESSLEKSCLISRIDLSNKELEGQINLLNESVKRSNTKLAFYQSALAIKSDSLIFLIAELEKSKTAPINETNDLDKYKIFGFIDIMESDSWSGYISVIGVLIGDRVEFLQIEDDIRELNKNEYSSFQIPKEATAAIALYSTGGSGIIYSTVDSEYLRIYIGGRGEEDTMFQVELLKEYKID